VQGVRIERSTNLLFDKDQIAVRGISCIDSDLTDTTAVVTLHQAVSEQVCVGAWLFSFPAAAPTLLGMRAEAPWYKREEGVRLLRPPAAPHPSFA
jgi:hypothetical protein